MRQVLVSTQAEVAAVFGVSADTVRTSWKPNDMPGPTDKGKWDLVAIGQWRRSRDAEGADLTEAKRLKLLGESRKAQAMAEKQEMDVSVRRGELIDRKGRDSEETIRQIRARDRILQLPREIVVYLPKAKRPEALASAEDHVRRAMTEMCEWADTGAGDQTPE